MHNQIVAILSLLSTTIHSLSNADLFLLSDAQLFQMGIDQWRLGFHNQLGTCRISENEHAACFYYASVCYPKNGTCLGLPDLIGTGCLNECWGPPNTYYNYQSSKIPICTGNIITDGANMMRIGILKGYCGITNNSSQENLTETTKPDNPDAQELVFTQKKTQGNPLVQTLLFWIGWGLAFMFLIVATVSTYLLLRQKKKTPSLAEKSFSYMKQDIHVQDSRPVK